MDGELVAQLTPQERMDMIQKGYIPGREEDVRRYFNNEKPTGEAVELAVFDVGDGTSLNNLGEKNVKGRFSFSNVQKDRMDEYNRTYNIEDFESDSRREPIANVSPKEAVKSKMESYQSKSNINDKLSNLLTTTQQRRPVQQQKVTQQQQRPLTKLGQPKSSLLKEQEVVADGYKDAVKYLNAFIRLLKESNTSNREALIDALNVFITKENTLSPQLLEVYRRGLTTAEKKMFEQLKVTKKNG